jgi:hypothetical protein
MAKSIDLSAVAVGDVLVLNNGCYAVVTREPGSPLWEPGSRGSVRAVYHHPTDDGWDGSSGEWNADGAKQSPGAWPEGSDVFQVITRTPGLTGPVGPTGKPPPRFVVVEPAPYKDGDGYEVYTYESWVEAIEAAGGTVVPP